MSEYSISIVDQGKIAPFFVKANTALINNHKEKISQSADKEAELCNLWLKEFRARLVKNGQIFDRIVFETSHDLTIFLLKYN